MKIRLEGVLFILYGLFLTVLIFKIQYVPYYDQDDLTYLQYASEIINFSILSNQNPTLWCGPGYPIIIIPFYIIFSEPKLPLVALNILFHLLSIYLLFKSLRYYLTNKESLIFTALFACYFPIFAELDAVMTEPLTILLLAFFVYFSTPPNKLKHNRKIIILGLIFGYICITKVIFGYVQLLLLLFMLLFYVYKKTTDLLHYLKIISYSYLITLPYLIFTYSLTSQKFFWANSGSENLYWMSTPYENEVGTWYPKNYFVETTKKYSYDTLTFRNHKVFMQKILNEKNSITQGKLYTTEAIKNIKNHPLKYCKNIFFNISRLYFDFPHTAVMQSKNTGFKMFPHSLLFVFSVVSIIYFFLHFHSISLHIKFLMLLIYTYLFLSILVSALPRQMNIIILCHVFIWGNLYQNFRKKYLKM